MVNPQQQIARLRTDRRQDDRREGTEAPLLPALLAFATAERRAFQLVERRHTLRRDCDVQDRLRRL
jgi:hypothetical protein